MVDRTRLDQWLADHNAKLIRRDADTRGRISNKWDVYAVDGRLMVVWSCFDNIREELDNIDVFLPATEENSWDATIAALDRFANETPVKVLVEIQGGALATIMTNTPVDVTLRDFDNIEAGDEDPLAEFGGKYETNYQAAGYPLTAL
jgi:hypothetical protein